MHKQHYLLGLFLAFLLFINPRELLAADRPSVILIIGDGLGISQQEAARLLNGPLAVDRMQSAVVRTGSQSDVVTDSAAAATAMGTGSKTRNRAIGVDAAGKVLPTLAEEAHRAGMGVGLVTTSYLFDATPMGFVIHAFDRSDTDAITKQVLAFKPEVLIGGGEADLLPAGVQGQYGPGHRKDGVNVLTAFKDAGYLVTTEPTAKAPLQLSLLAGHEMYASEGSLLRPLSPVTLPVMLNAALTSLNAQSGFFLLAEEEQTDEAAHLNDIVGTLRAVQYWNAAVEVALRYQSKHPKTIVLATSDHETGGLQIMKASDCKPQSPGAQVITMADGKSFCLKFTTKQHTASPVILYASGISLPERIIENTEVYTILRKAMALKPGRAKLHRTNSLP